MKNLYFTNSATPRNLRLTHFNSDGHIAQVCVGQKKTTRRQAIAYGEIQANPPAIQALADQRLAKGDAFAAAKISGILAAKRTAQLIPLCHGLNLEWADLSFQIYSQKIGVTASVKAFSKTGVEMEALTAVSVACLTLYDMLKSLDKSIVIGPIYLLEKRGGKSGVYRRQ